MQHITLGTFDIAIDGGGIDGFVRAMHYAGLGRTVVIIEPRGSLMREVTRAGLSYFPENGGDGPDSFRMFAEELRKRSGLYKHTFDLVRTEYVAELLARQLGIAVLYHARVAHTSSGASNEAIAGEYARHARLVVLKGKTGVLYADTVVGDERRQSSTGSKTPPFSVWTLTWANASITDVRETSLTLDGRILPIRIRPGFNEGTAVTDIVFESDADDSASAELLFNSLLGDIAGLLRGQLSELQHAHLIHAGDEPFPFTPASPIADDVWMAINRAAMDLFRGRLA